MSQKQEWISAHTQDFRNYKEMHTYETKDCQKKKIHKKNI